MLYDLQIIQYIFLLSLLCSWKLWACFFCFMETNTFLTQSWSWQRLKSQSFSFFVRDPFFSSSTSNFLCMPSFEILKVVLIGSDLPDIPGLKDEWINLAEYSWICYNAISILANWIENEMRCVFRDLFTLL